MKIHCVIDNKSKKDKRTYEAIINSLLSLREQYSSVINVYWDFEYKDLSELDWIEYGYGKDNYGVNTNWIKKDVARIKDQRPGGYEYDCVVYFIDQSNWTDKGNAIWGWNLGLFYSNYQVQLVQARDYNRGVELTLKMEVAHSLDNFIHEELGIDLSKFFNVPSFDEDIIHGRHNDWKIFEYAPAIQRMSELLKAVFLKRLMKRQLSLLWVIIRLYRILFMTRKNENSPVFEEDIEVSKEK